tara:strand:- start:140 stop:247 length:108 start_codon:yes stop_codon:yes gene_type:complete
MKYTTDEPDVSSDIKRNFRELLPAPETRKGLKFLH